MQIGSLCKAALTSVAMSASPLTLGQPPFIKWVLAILLGLLEERKASQNWHCSATFQAFSGSLGSVWSMTVRYCHQSAGLPLPLPLPAAFLRSNKTSKYFFHSALVFLSVLDVWDEEATLGCKCGADVAMMLQHTTNSLRAHTRLRSCKRSFPACNTPTVYASCVRPDFGVYTGQTWRGHVHTPVYTRIRTLYGSVANNPSCYVHFFCDSWYGYARIYGRTRIWGVKCVLWAWGQISATWAYTAYTSVYNSVYRVHICTLYIYVQLLYSCYIQLLYMYTCYLQQL